MTLQLADPVENVTEDSSPSQSVVHVFFRAEER
jgi:hypothetical protein